MKRLFDALVLLIISCVVLFSWKIYQSRAPDFEEMAEFDPSGYVCTNALQTFKLNPHDRNWTLSSVVHYNAEGIMEYETVYEMDKNGQSYYMNGDKRVNVSQMPRVGFNGLADIHADHNIIKDGFDEFGRLISRTSYYNSPNTIFSIQLYYSRDSQGRSDDDAISNFVITDYFTEWESTSYYIANLDKYGNETSITLGDANCCMSTDADGYLQMIIIDNVATYFVYRVDESGRPLWSAVYGKEDGLLWEYTVWNYKELS